MLANWASEALDGHAGSAWPHISGRMVFPELVQQGKRTHIMKNLIARFVREDEGQDIIEYSLLAAFISISGYLILSSIGTSVNTIYTKVQTATTAASS
jgi:pilus assembly protein Flp/PilA